MQVVINGIINGLALAVLASAFSIVYLPTRVFFMGLAGVLVWAPFSAHTALAHGSPLLLAALGGVAVAALLSVMLEIVVHRPLLRRGASEGTHLVSSLGTHIVLVQLASILWGKTPRTLRHGLDQAWGFGSAVVTRSQLIVGFGCALALLAFLVWLHRSDLGMRFRAMFSNRQQLALLGHNTAGLTVTAFCIAGLLGGWFAVLHAIDGTIEPNSGLRFLILAIVAVVIGGRESFFGPLAGALFLGIVRSAAVWFLSAQWQEVITFLILLLFLVIRPRGLFGSAPRLEVS